MVGFSSKEISNPLSLAQRLKEGREKAGISISEAAKVTGISIKYLEVLETGSYHKLPGEVYAKSFLKAYAKSLGLDQSEVLKLYKSEQRIYTKIQTHKINDFKKPVEKVSKAHLIVTPRIIKGLLIGLLAVACLVYLGLKVQAIITPPLLVITSPADNLATEQNFIEIIGQTEAEIILEINGQQVLADQEGNFQEVIDLQSGVNIIEVKAIKRHGKETKKYLQIVVLEKEGENN